MLVIGVAKGHDVVVHHHHLFNCPRADDVMSQYFQKSETTMNWTCIA